MVKKYRPTSPGRRAQTILSRPARKNKPTKEITNKLTDNLHRVPGRAHGRIMVYQRRSGAKRRYRTIDFKRDKYDIPGIVEEIQYDPNRTSDIALVLYPDGDKRYILAPIGIKAGDTVVSGEKVEVRTGNAMPLANIPVGTPLHNIEIYPKAGGRLVRSAGAAAFVSSREGKYVQVKMPSGEVRKFLAVCFATIGQLSNDEWKLVSLGKAGRAYHMGRRPKTRAKVRPDSHPLAGSYSRRLGRQPVDRWGHKSKGKKTRSRTHTNKYIVKDRRKRT